MGIAVPVKTLQSVVEQMIKRRIPAGSLPPQPLHEQWASSFLKRHNLKKMRQKPIELARKEAHTPELLKEWFDKLKQVINEYNIQQINFWNFDETGFRIGVGRSKWIVTADPRRRAWIPSDTSRKHLTAIEAVNATGEYIEPILIAAGKVLQERWFKQLTNMTLVGTLESGYINDELALEWI
jgi:hypothetical protein